jgi:hypothetical protein
MGVEPPTGASRTCWNVTLQRPNTRSPYGAHSFGRASRFTAQHRVYPLRACLENPLGHAALGSTVTT